MSLESATYIDGLDITNPTSTDPKSQGDDHLRLIKSAVKATFPNIAGAVTPTHTELNYVDGVTSAIQTQIDAITTLADGKIYVGNGSNVATEVTLTGDVTMTNAGVTAIGSGVIVNADISAFAAIAISKLATGTANYYLGADGSGDPVYKQLKSSPATQTYTGGGKTYTFAHGLSAAPGMVQVKLVNNTTDQGYSPGDVLYINIAADANSGGTNRGLTAKVDSTNVVLYVMTGGIGIVTTGYAHSGAIDTSGKWDIGVVSYA